MDASEFCLRALDEERIQRLLFNWGIWRDTGDWESLRSCYTADATMAISWMDGPASDFVSRCASRAATTADRPNLEFRSSSSHAIGGAAITVRRDHAVADGRVTMTLRALISDVEVDILGYARFFDLLRFSDERWRIARRVAVFEKDMIQTVVPGAELQLDSDILSTFPSGYRHFAYALSMRGSDINLSLPAPGTPSMRALEDAGREWLQKA